MKKIFIGALLLIGLIIVDGVFSTKEIKYGTVVDKQYQSKQTHTGVGNGISTNGNPTVVVTSSTTPEKFLLMVKSENGKILTVECTPELYYGKEKENEIEFATYKGYITSITYSHKGIK